MIGAVVAHVVRRRGGSSARAGAWIAAIADGREPVRDPLRDRSADVLARDPARRVRASSRSSARSSGRRSGGSRWFGARGRCSVYTQYWSFYLLVVVVGLLVVDGVARASTATRRDACSSRWRSAGSRSSRGCRRSSTSARTPERRGARRCCPGIPLGYTLRDFAGGASGTAADRQEGWLLFFVLLPMLSSACSGAAIDERRIEIDLHIPREVRVIAFVGGAGLVVALTLNYLAGGAFQSRYSAIVFPFFVLLVARGLHDAARPADPGRCARRRGRARIRRAACATSSTQRTQAGAGRGGAARRGEARRPRRVLPRPARPVGAPARASRASTRSSYPSFAGPGARRLGRLQEAAGRGRPGVVRRRPRSPAPARTRSGT